MARYEPTFGRSNTVESPPALEAGSDSGSVVDRFDIFGAKLVHVDHRSARSVVRVRPIEPSDLAHDQVGGDQVGRDDAKQAARNGASLGGSLLYTAALGLIMSIFIVPNVLSDIDVGILGGSEGLATLSLVFAGFGMDSYLRKEVAVRREHASEFFSALLILRLGVTIIFTALALAVLRFRDADLENYANASKSMQAVLLFCIAQFFIQTSEAFAAMLQAIGQVKTQSQFAVVSKTIWALMVGVGLYLGLGLWIVPLALILTEFSKTVVFGLGVQRSIALTWRPTFSFLPSVLKAAFPFLVTTVSVKLIQFLDVTMIRFLTGSDRETGLYTQAMRLSSVALLLAPMIQWVVLPMASRAVERSRSDFAGVVRRSFEIMLCVSFPISILLCLNADLIMRITPKYVAAVPALRILSLLIALSYVTMLGGTLLIADGRGWRVVRITFITIGVDFVLNLYLIKHGWVWWGQGTGFVKDGGAGFGASLSLITAEFVGASLFLFELRKVVRRLADRSSVRRMALTAAACGLLVAFDRVIVSFAGLGRPMLDFIFIVVVLRAVNVIEPTWFGMAWEQARRRIGSRK